MPTYDYLCQNCQASFEMFQSITAKPLRKCPKCGKNTLKRLIGSGAGVIFKGSGFYQTDYRSESYKKAAQKENPASSTAGDSKTAPSNKSAAKNPSAKKQTNKNAGKKT